MDLKQLEYYVRVAELGSFTRAAQALDVAQPALSRQIRLLEVELRQTLLTRNGRGAVPTEAGKLLLDHGRGILHQVARAREELGRVRGALAGRVAIGLPPSVARSLTVPLTRAFRQQLPQATLSITEGLSAHMQEWLTTGRLDIAVLYNAQPSPEVELLPLHEEELLLVQAQATEPSTEASAPPPADGLQELGAPMALAQVARMPLVIPSRPNAVRMQLEGELAKLGLKPLVALEIDGVPAILDLVADGAGAAILSRNALANARHPSAYRLSPLLPSLCSHLSLATSAVRPATLTQQAALGLMQEKLQALTSAAKTPPAA